MLISRFAWLYLISLTNLTFYMRISRFAWNSHVLLGTLTICLDSLTFCLVILIFYLCQNIYSKKFAVHKVHRINSEKTFKFQLYLAKVKSNWKHAIMKSSWSICVNKIKLLKLQIWACFRVQIARVHWRSILLIVFQKIFVFVFQFL